MRRFLSLLSIFVFIIISIASICFADTLEDKKEELQRVKKYVLTLDAKIIAARDARQINRIAKLKELKRRQLDRADLLKAEIAKLEKGEAVPEPEPEALPAPEPAPEPEIAKVIKEEWRGWLAEGGYGGGALQLGGGYRFPFRNLKLVAKLDFGMGNEYTTVTAGLRAVFPVGPDFAGAELGVVDYSETVTDIPGVSGNIERGMQFGFGVFAGRPVELPFAKLDARIAYNTALGITASAIYSF